MELHTFKENRIKLSDSIILLLALCAAVSFLGGLTGLQILTSVSFAFSLLLVFFIFLGDIIKTGKINILLICLLACMLLSILNGGLQLSFEYYKRAIITFCTFICIVYSANAKISLKTKNIMTFIFNLLALLTIFYFYVLGYNKIGFGTTALVAFNFDNPNVAGLWVFSLFVFLFSNLFTKIKNSVKIFYLIVCCFLFHILSATGSRNSLFASILFAAIRVIIQIFKIKKLPKWVLLTFVLLPIIVFFVYMYLFLPNIKSLESLFSFLNTEKSLTTRNEIWQLVIEDFKTCFLFGAYSEYHNEQMHNSLITIFTMFGIVFTLLSCACIYKACKNLQNFISIEAAFTLCAILFTGCFEASVFVGIGGFFVVLLIAPIYTSNSLKK